MKFLFLLMAFNTGISLIDWHTDFEKARQVAKDKKELIMLNFSGSDWCGPCIRLRKEVFESDAFNEVADNSLILVNADFPRNKKNQLSAELQRQNESLADTYNPQGKFPYTVILTPEGKVIKSWEGYPGYNSEQFIAQIKSVCNAYRH
jgi:thioredoxin-related protein